MEQLAQQASALLSEPAGLILLAIGTIAGLILGLLIAAFGWKRKDSGNAATVNQLQNDFDDYKSQVNNHFSKTSDLVGKLTDDYREVYRHLATGSAALCSVADSESRIGFDDNIQLADKSSDQQKADAAKDVTDNRDPKTDDKENTPTSDNDEPATAEENQTTPPVAATIPDKIDLKAKTSGDS